MFQPTLDNLVMSTTREQFWLFYEAAHLENSSVDGVASWLYENHLEMKIQDCVQVTKLQSKVWNLMPDENLDRLSAVVKNVLVNNKIGSVCTKDVNLESQVYIVETLALIPESERKQLIPYLSSLYHCDGLGKDGKNLLAAIESIPQPERSGLITALAPLSARCTFAFVLRPLIEEFTKVDPAKRVLVVDQVLKLLHPEDSNWGVFYHLSTVASISEVEREDFFALVSPLVSRVTDVEQRAHIYSITHELPRDQWKRAATILVKFDCSLLQLWEKIKAIPDVLDLLEVVEPICAQYKEAYKTCSVLSLYEKVNREDRARLTSLIREGTFAYGFSLSSLLKHVDDNFVDTMALLLPYFESHYFEGLFQEVVQFPVEAREHVVRLAASLPGSLSTQLLRAFKKIDCREWDSTVTQLLRLNSKTCIPDALIELCTFEKKTRERVVDRLIQINEGRWNEELAKEVTSIPGKRFDEIAELYMKLTDGDGYTYAQLFNFIAKLDISDFITLNELSLDIVCSTKYASARLAFANLLLNSGEVRRVEMLRTARALKSFTHGSSVIERLFTISKALRERVTQLLIDKVGVDSWSLDSIVRDIMNISVEMRPKILSFIEQNIPSLKNGNQIRALSWIYNEQRVEATLLAMHFLDRCLDIDRTIKVLSPLWNPLDIFELVKPALETFKKAEDLVDFMLKIEKIPEHERSDFLRVIMSLLVEVEQHCQLSSVAYVFSEMEHRDRLVIGEILVGKKGVSNLSSTASALTLFADIDKRDALPLIELDDGGYGSIDKLETFPVESRVELLRLLVNTDCRYQRGLFFKIIWLVPPEKREEMSKPLAKVLGKAGVLSRDELLDAFTQFSPSNISAVIMSLCASTTCLKSRDSYGFVDVIKALSEVEAEKIDQVVKVHQALVTPLTTDSIRLVEQLSAEECQLACGEALPYLRRMSVDKIPGILPALTKIELKGLPQYFDLLMPYVSGNHRLEGLEVFALELTKSGTQELIATAAHLFSFASSYAAMASILRGVKRQALANRQAFVEEMASLIRECNCADNVGSIVEWAGSAPKESRLSVLRDSIAHLSYNVTLEGAIQFFTTMYSLDPEIRKEVLKDAKLLMSNMPMYDKEASIKDLSKLDSIRRKKICAFVVTKDERMRCPLIALALLPEESWDEALECIKLASLSGSHGLEEFIHVIAAVPSKEWRSAVKLVKSTSKYFSIDILSAYFEVDDESEREALVNYISKFNYSYPKLAIKLLQLVSLDERALIAKPLEVLVSSYSGILKVLQEVDPHKRTTIIIALSHLLSKHPEQCKTLCNKLIGLYEKNCYLVSIPSSIERAVLLEAAFKLHPPCVLSDELDAEEWVARSNKPKHAFSLLCREGILGTNSHLVTRSDMQCVVEDLYPDCNVGRFLGSVYCDSAFDQQRNSVLFGRFLYLLGNNKGVLNSELAEAFLRIHNPQLKQRLLTQLAKDFNCKTISITKSHVRLLIQRFLLQLTGNEDIRFNSKDAHLLQEVVDYFCYLSEGTEDERKSLFRRGFSQLPSTRKTFALIQELKAAVAIGLKQGLLTTSHTPIELLRQVFSEKFSLDETISSSAQLKFVLSFRNIERLFIYKSKVASDANLSALMNQWVARMIENSSDFSWRNRESKHAELIPKVTWSQWCQERVEPLQLESVAGIKEDFKEKFLFSLNHGHFKDDDYPELAKRLKGESYSENALNLFERTAFTLLDEQKSAKWPSLLNALLGTDSIPSQFKADISGWIKSLTFNNAKTVGCQIVITGDPALIFHCGTDVHGSCQSVNGSYSLNKALMGYVLDGKVRMVAILDSQGKIEHRAIIRLLIDERKDPVIVIERAYGIGGGVAYSRAVEKRALEFARELGIPLLCQDGSGELYSGRVRSYGNVAPYEYVDSMGHGITKGTYLFSKLRYKK